MSCNLCNIFSDEQDWFRHTSRSGVHQLDKILKKLSCLIFYSNILENALNRYFNVSAFRKIWVYYGFEHQKVEGKQKVEVYWLCTPKSRGKKALFRLNIFLRSSLTSYYFTNMLESR